MIQEWRQLTFLHWPYSPEQLAPRLPRGLSLDLFEGSAWVSLTPFLLDGLRPSLLPPLPWISRFPETNLRTYVRGPDGTPGIWFYSLDCARAAAVAGARLAFGLPYMWSRMRVETEGSRVAYLCRRIWPDRAAHTSIRIERGGAIPKNDLANFLVERYRLFSVIAGWLTFTAVWHEPWPLEAVRILELDQTVTDAAGLGHPAAAPVAHFSPGVRVRVAYPRPVTEVPA